MRLAAFWIGSVLASFLLRSATTDVLPGPPPRPEIIVGVLATGLPVDLSGRLGWASAFVSQATGACWPYLVAGGLLTAIGWVVTGTILRLRRQLRESEGLRREAEKFVAGGRMAAHVAHEINNPMAGIVNCLHLVKATLESDHPAERYVAAAEREATRITRIVRQMLALHRCRPEKAGLFHVGSLMEDVALMLQPVACRRSVRIEMHVAGGDEDCVRLPEESLRQVLFNLLTNAIEASSPGDVVCVDAERDGSQLGIVVSDTGAGISEEILDRVFEPFYSTKTESGAGLGLGLPISRGIVESLGGTMTLESQLGMGTRCHIRLPLQADTFRLDRGSHIERVPCQFQPSANVPVGYREEHASAGRTRTEEENHG